MKKLIIIFIGIFILFSNQAVFGQVQNTKWLDGTWVGEGYQPGALTQQTWQIILVYDYQKQEIIISYPSFPCSGYWTLEKADKQIAIFTEKITEGKNLCVNEEKVIVTRIDDEYITVSYFIAELDGVAAFSTLRKKKDNINK